MQKPGRKNWLDWLASDPALSREVLALAAPVVLGMASITAIGLVDTIMVGRLGAQALAATGIASMVFWAVHWATRSVETAVQALVARRYGEQNLHACGKVLDNALILGACVGTMGGLLLFTGSDTLMGLLSSYDDVVENGRGYIRILACVLWCSSMFFAIRGFFSGLGKTRVFFISAFLMLTLNIAGNYAFIFGNFGMPALGVPGAALASALAFLTAFVFMTGYLLGWYGRNFRLEFNALQRTNISLVTMGEIVRLAGPNAFRGVMVIGGLLIFYAMVDKLDVVQVAVVNVVLNIQSVSFMPGFGFGVAAATVIGQSLGSGNPKKAERAGYEALKLAMVFMGSLGVLFLVAPEYVVRLFTNDQAVIENTIFPLRLVGIVQTLDAAGMVFSSALEGAGNTRWVMAAEIAVNWGIFLPLTYLFTFVMSMGRYGPWAAWATYLTVFGIWCWLKFRKGDWKEIRI